MKKRISTLVACVMVMTAAVAPAAFAAQAAPGNSDFVGSGGKNANSTNNFAPASSPGNS